MYNIDPQFKQQISQTIFRFIDPKEYRVFIFGSRATGKNAKFSDLDIGIEGNRPIPGHIMSEIKGSFEETNLPFFVDVVDFKKTAQNFNAVAKQSVIYLN